MQIGDIVRAKPGFEFYGTDPDEYGLVIKTDKSLEVTSNCVKVVWSHKICMARISMLELISASR